MSHLEIFNYTYTGYLSGVYSSGNKFVIFCRVAATLQNITNLFPLLYFRRRMPPKRGQQLGDSDSSEDSSTIKKIKIVRGSEDEDDDGVV